MFEPVKAGFGQFMGRFFSQIIPTTQPLKEYVARDFDKAVVWCPSRMIDTVTEQLAMWQRNDTDGAPTAPYKLPVIIVAVANDYMPTGRDYRRQLSESVMVTLPGDTKERLFGMRTIAADISVQVAIFATDEPTAKSIASQFISYLDTMGNHTFMSMFPFAGFDLEWPTQIESPEAPASAVDSESKNVRINAVRLNLKTIVPLFNHPKDNEPNDGKGTDGDANDPHGYPAVTQIITNQVGWH